MALVEPARARISFSFVALLTQRAPSTNVGNLGLGGSGAFGIASSRTGKLQKDFASRWRLVKCTGVS